MKQRDKLKLLFISQHYKPEPCDTRTSQLAEEMANLGHEATSLTSFPNYPFGKIYEAYKQKLWQKERHGDVNVVRVPMYPDHSLSKKKRAFSYLSFGFTASFLGSVLTRRPDLVWIHHPPLTTGIAGAFLSLLKRVPYVYEIHDLWPETLMSCGMIREGRVTRAIRKVCNALHKRAEAIVVTSQGMKEHLADQGVPYHKIHVMPQWVDEEVYQPQDRDLEFGLKHGLTGKFNVLFAGNIGVAQGLDTLLDAASKVRDLENVQFVVLGDGVELERLRERAHEEGLTNVRFLGHHPSSLMPAFFAWADAMLIHLKLDPLFAITVPSKTQVYMACGRPVLCGVEGDTAQIVLGAKAGLACQPESPDEMAEAVRALAAMPEAEREAMGARARAAFEEQFSKRALVARYDHLFRSIARRQPHLTLDHAVTEPDTAASAKQAA